ncbi:hypothetical protein BX600DRAFT_428505 [Xylariales sp. PMI_506]|nr:hypothetical protein BX600DRAFT_428505 [Xylariales sp. PMI_506]
MDFVFCFAVWTSLRTLSGAGGFPVLRLRLATLGVSRAWLRLEWRQLRCGAFRSSMASFKAEWSSGEIAFCAPALVLEPLSAPVLGRSKFECATIQQRHYLFAMRMRKILGFGARYSLELPSSN